MCLLFATVSPSANMVHSKHSKMLVELGVLTDAFILSNEEAGAGRYELETSLVQSELQGSQDYTVTQMVLPTQFFRLWLCIPLRRAVWYRYLL